MIVKACDFRNLGLCASGLRSLCEQHGYRYIDFVHIGIDHEELLAIDDDMIRSYVYRVIENKEVEK